MENKIIKVFDVFKFVIIVISVYPIIMYEDYSKAISFFLFVSLIDLIKGWWLEWERKKE